VVRSATTRAPPPCRRESRWRIFDHNAFHGATPRISLPSSKDRIRFAALTSRAVTRFSGTWSRSTQSYFRQRRVAEVTIAYLFAGRHAKVLAPGKATIPSTSLISMRSTSRSSASWSARGSSSRIVLMLAPVRNLHHGLLIEAMLPRPDGHTRATAAVESTNTPSISNSTPRHRIGVISHNNRTAERVAKTTQFQTKQPARVVSELIGGGRGEKISWRIA